MASTAAGPLMLRKVNRARKRSAKGLHHSAGVSDDWAVLGIMHSTWKGLAARGPLQEGRHVSVGQQTRNNEQAVQAGTCSTRLAGGAGMVCDEVLNSLGDKNTAARRGVISKPGEQSETWLQSSETMWLRLNTTK